MNPHLPLSLLTSTALFLFLTNVFLSPAYFAFSTSVPTMKTFIFSLKLLGNCLTWMVSLSICLTIFFIVSSTIFSNLNPLFTRSLRNLFISAFLSLTHTLFKFAPKSLDLTMLLIPILTFNLFPLLYTHLFFLSF